MIPRRPKSGRIVINLISNAHGAVMAIMAVHLPNERGHLLTAAVVMSVIGAVLIVLGPAKRSGVLASATGHA
jgi:hypothetical protein